MVGLVDREQLVHTTIELSYSRKIMVGYMFVLVSCNVLVNAVKGEGSTIEHEHFENVGVLDPTQESISWEIHYSLQSTQAVGTNMHTTIQIRP